MALPLTINNPQTSEPITSVAPVLGETSISYAGNAVGSGASTTDSGISNILIYGVIGLAVVWILQRLEN